MSQTTTLIPHLVCRDANSAIEFYQKAFGATPLCVLPLPDGKIMHAAMSIDGATFYLVEEFPNCGSGSPLTLGGTAVTLHLQVADCETLYARATEAGCQIVLPLQDMPWGDRYGIVKDPFGHSWSIATTVRQLTPDELQDAVTAMAGAGV